MKSFGITDVKFPAQLAGPTLEDWASTNEIPYHRLTHLDLDAGLRSHLTWAEVTDIFGLARNLRACSLQGIDRYYEAIPTFPPRVVLERLQHLYLSSVDSKLVNPRPINVDIVPSLNQILTAPSLQTLSIVNYGELPLDTIAYTEFITRSGCSLQKLQLTPCPKSDADALLQALRLSSATLRVFSSAHPAILTKQFANAMSRWDEGAGQFDLCPELEEISVHFQNKSPKFKRDPLADITKMLLKRRVPPDGSDGALKMLSVPSSIMEVALPSLVLLGDHDPYSMDIEYRVDDLAPRPVWEREEYL